MYSQSDIEDAVQGGALTTDQAASLRNFVATRNGVPTADEEHFRFIIGFNDIFAFIACGFALVAVGWLGTLISPQGPRFGMPLPISAPFAALFVAAASWGLAEIFTRKRHLALVSLLLTFTFTWGVALFLMTAVLSGGMVRDQVGGAIVIALCMGAGAGAAWLHWKRFQVPAAIATGAGFVILAVIALVGVMMIGGRDTLQVISVITIFAGVGAFFYAMRWDAQDLSRHTEKSDVAFWLHWLAAGLIVNGLTQLFGLSDGIHSAIGAIGVIVIYLMFAVLALAVNRKIILVAGLTPLILAIRGLVSDGGYRARPSSPYGNPYSSYGGSVSPYGSGSYSGSYGRSSVSAEGTMLTVLIIGVILLLLAIYWAPARRAVVGMLPEGLRARVPPTGAEPVAQADTFE